MVQVRDLLQALVVMGEAVKARTLQGLVDRHVAMCVADPMPPPDPEDEPPTPPVPEVEWTCGLPSF